MQEELIRIILSLALRRSAWRSDLRAILFGWYFTWNASLLCWAPEPCRENDDFALPRMARRGQFSPGKRRIFYDYIPMITISFQNKASDDASSTWYYTIITYPSDDPTLISPQRSMPPRQSQLRSSE
jgi:hypothetical protein